MGEIRFCQFPPGRAHESPVILSRRCGRDAHDRVIAIRADDRVGFPAQPVRSSSVLGRSDTLAKQLPEHGDSTVRGSQVLQAMDGDRPLTDLSFVVAGLPLTRFVRIGGELAGRHNVVGPPSWRDARGLARMP